MKIKEGFLLREVAHQHVVVPVGETALNFNGVITLNESGAFLWKLLVQGADEQGLVSELMAHFEVSLETAQADVRVFLAKLTERNLLVSHE